MTKMLIELEKPSQASLGTIQAPKKNPKEPSSMRLSTPLLSSMPRCIGEGWMEEAKDAVSFLHRDRFREDAAVH